MKIIHNCFSSVANRQTGISRQKCDVL